MGNLLQPAAPAVCLINAHLGQAFRDLGHTVLELHPGPGILDIGRELEERKFQPDLLLQVERLDGRVVLQGLESLPCPKLFWAIDPHLNQFWQVHYGRLFDAVLSTQSRCLPGFRAAGNKQTFWLPWHGFDRPYVPFKDRVHQVAFVGRVTSHRPLRQAMVRYLSERFGAAHFQDIPAAEMLDIYDRTRLAPNEAILGEINFRLFEAASCGCLVLDPNTDNGLAELFRPGLEVETYDHALDLQAKLAWYQAHPAEVERGGLAAWHRVRASHLPIHRARFIAELMPSLSRAAATGAEADKRFLLTLAGLRQSGRLNLDRDTLLRGLARMPDDPEVLASLIVLLAEEGLAPQAQPSLADILCRDLFVQDGTVNLAGSMAALRLGSWDLAKAFWLRQARLNPITPITSKSGRNEPAGPDSSKNLHLLWATELTRQGATLRPGFMFDQARHLPLTAAENLLAAYLLDPADLEVVRRLDTALAAEPGTEQTRLALLSYLSLHRPEDWRTGFRLGMVNLRAFRMDQGLEELCLAKDKAATAGREESFVRMLAAEDPGGMVGRAMGWRNRLNAPA